MLGRGCGGERHFVELLRCTVLIRPGTNAVDGPPAQWAHGGLPRRQFLDDGVACQHRGEVGQRAASGARDLSRPL